MDNLIFIGLPGCGKSTIGAMVAKALALPFYDADIVTERLAGETIPHMFEKGEAYFRTREQKRFVSFAKRIAASFLAAAVL